MTKTDDVLLALSRTRPKYVKSIGHFEHKGKTYLLDNNFISSHHMKCDICGNYPINDISVIRSDNGERLNTGPSCIDKIANQKVSTWFKTFRKKRDNVRENRNYIDGLSAILDAYERNELAFKISNEDVKKLQKMYDQMCNGLNPESQQKHLAEHYINHKVKS
jgi:hypothetical protein